MARACDGDMNAILGELQAAFIYFLMGQDFNSFEHWKQLLVMLCKCESAADTHTQFMMELVDVVLHQLKHVPIEMFDETLIEKNLVYQSLKVCISYFITI